MFLVGLVVFFSFIIIVVIILIGFLVHALLQKTKNEHSTNRSTSPPKLDSTWLPNNKHSDWDVKNRPSAKTSPSKEEAPSWYQKQDIPMGSNRRRSATSNAVIYITWSKAYQFEIVGESNYQKDLLTIAGNKEEKSKAIECFAQLIREPNNQYDKNAVVVKIQNKIVGYLSRDDAKSYTKAIKSIGYDELSICNVRAMIVGGWKKGKSEGSYGVKLDLPLEFARFKYSHSAISFDDADSKLEDNPLSQDQKHFLKFFSLKTSSDVNYFNFAHYADQQLKLIKADNPELYNQWLALNDELSLQQEIYEFWDDKDEREMYDIKKPRKSDMSKAIQNLLDQGKTCDDMVDDPDLVYEELIKINPSLEK